ncbi:MAG: LPS export ABC transporter periplasmic protein LptC [Bacteroidia bacterium]|jgi:LPS export ABC transporter protein LptC|nr:LPS export ABC transporter periplasmic protein LptC [Bacteroidia bacterium]
MMRAATGIVLLLLAACSNDPREVKRLTQKDTLPLQTAKEVTLYYSDSARLKIKLTAPQIDDYAGSEPRTVMPKGMKVEFYDEDMKVNSSISARYAVRNERTNLMEARNNVVVVNTKGEKLETEQLFWDDRIDSIYTDKKVKVTSGSQIIHSEGLRADQTFNNYRFKKVTGIFALPDSDNSPK